MIVRLNSAGSFLTTTNEPYSGKSSIDKPVMLVYRGDFESMDGPVSVTDDHLKGIAEKHNSRFSQLKRLAGVGEVPLRECPPVQLDHSTSATMTVGRLIGDIELREAEIDGEKRLAAFSTLRVLGKENVEKVEDGRWSNVSIGADFENGDVNELSITPFPAAAKASMLSKTRLASKILDTVNNYELWVTQSPEMKKFSDAEFSYGIKPLKSNKWVDLSGFRYESESEALEAARKAVKLLPPATKLSKGGNEMKERLKAFLTKFKKLSEKEADEKLAKMDEEEEKKLAAEADDADKKEKEESEKKDKLKKHLMDKEKLSEADAEDKLSKMEDSDKINLLDEMAKMGPMEIKINHDQQMAAKAAFTKLSGMVKRTSTPVMLAAKKERLVTRLSKLKADAKITPAEIKKMDLAKMAGESDEVINAKLSTFDARQPVIDSATYGTRKADDITRVQKKYRLAKLELQSRLNMSMKKKDAEKQLAALAEEEAKEMAGLGAVPVPGSEGNPALGEPAKKLSYDEVCKLIDGGADKEAVKAALRSCMSVDEPDAQTPGMSALAEEVKELHTGLKELTKLVGPILGLKSEELE